MKTILVVDDDRGVLQCIASILKRFHYAVIAADSARTALSAVAAGEEPALAIIDYQLPEMNGLDLVRILKQALPSLPVIVLTGNGSLETYCAAGSLGVEKYVLKPIRARELGQLVAEMLHEAPPDSPSTPTSDYDFVLKQLKPATGQRTGPKEA